jgi:DNA-binding protein HU-beta
MTKAEVISKIIEETGIDRSEVSAAIESLLEVIKDSMADGNEIFIRGFGSFIIKKRARKTARHIRKDTAMIVPEHYIPQFRPSPEFVEKIKTSKKINQFQKSERKQRSY